MKYNEVVVLELHHCCTDSSISLTKKSALVLKESEEHTSFDVRYWISKLCKRLTLDRDVVIGTYGSFFVAFFISIANLCPGSDSGASRADDVRKTKRFHSTEKPSASTLQVLEALPDLRAPQWRKVHDFRAGCRRP